MSRVLIASDIHANLEAAKNMFKETSYDYSIFLGDLVDYGPKPSETVQLFRDNFDELIQGNHDYAVSHNSDDMCSPEKHEISVYTRENITKKLMAKDEITYVGNLKRSLIAELDGVRVACFHGKPSDPLFGYLYPWEISSEKMRNDDGRLPTYDYVIVGHTHYQFLSQYDGMVFLNPGSCGQPRDRSHMAGYAILDTRKNTVELKHFNYDKFNLARDLKLVIPERKYLEMALRLFRLI